MDATFIFQAVVFNDFQNETQGLVIEVQKVFSVLKQNQISEGEVIMAREKDLMECSGSS